MRVKRGVVSRRKHNKVQSANKGYRGAKRRLVRAAIEASLHAGSYAYHGRKRRKRDMRRMWILRIGQASSSNGLSYSKLIAGLRIAKIELDRKILSDLVVTDPETFKAIVDRIKAV